jgi:hypothetical protein
LFVEDVILTNIENVYREKDREVIYACIANEYVADDLPLRLHIQIFLNTKKNTSKKGIKEILRMYHFYCFFSKQFHIIILLFVYFLIKQHVAFIIQVQSPIELGMSI